MGPWCDDVSCPRRCASSRHPSVLVCAKHGVVASIQAIFKECALAGMTPRTATPTGGVALAGTPSEGGARGLKWQTPWLGHADPGAASPFNRVHKLGSVRAIGRRWKRCEANLGASESRHFQLLVVLVENRWQKERVEQPTVCLIRTVFRTHIARSMVVGSGSPFTPQWP